MTDLEISQALALAIGWTERQMFSIGDELNIGYDFDSRGDELTKVFDYRDWNVIGPIAERYDCFPDKCCGEWSAMVAINSLTWVEASTPQKAIALAIIGANK